MNNVTMRDRMEFNELHERLDDMVWGATWDYKCDVVEDILEDEYGVKCIEDIEEFSSKFEFKLWKKRVHGVLGKSIPELIYGDLFKQTK